MSILKPEVNEKDHAQGPESASIEIVEFGDYECPHCGEAYPVIKKIQKIFGNQIRFVFRNFPLSESHAYAYPAALASEAAAVQNKFWEMHDAIFENQNRINEDLFKALAKNIGLNEEAFERDIESNDIIKKVEDDFESGMRSGVNGTPSFYVNGHKFDGSVIDLFDMLKESAS